MKKAVEASADWRMAKTTALYLPSVKLTTDNAAMIAAAGYLSAVRHDLRASKKDFTNPNKLKAQGNLVLN